MYVCTVHVAYTFVYINIYKYIYIYMHIRCIMYNLYEGIHTTYIFCCMISFFFACSPRIDFDSNCRLFILPYLLVYYFFSCVALARYYLDISIPCLYIFFLFIFFYFCLYQVYSVIAQSNFAHIPDWIAIHACTAENVPTRPSWC